ncbi:MAG: AAA family ATPase [Acidimicrobiia bacterium]|nr:AAA family ATPase [Acidimicrobiia bacterium]
MVDRSPMDNVADLRVLLASRHALLLAETQDEERFRTILDRAADELDLPVWLWSATTGLARVGLPVQYGTRNPHLAIQFINDNGLPGVYVFADAHPILDDSRVVRGVKELAMDPPEGQTVILTAPKHEVPAELEGLAHVWRLRPPDAVELRELAERTFGDLADRDMTVDLSVAAIDELVSALAGLSLGEAERLIQRAALSDGSVSDGDLPSIRQAKAELLAGDGILELVEANVGSLDDVGGFDNLKEWLVIRSAVFTGASVSGIDPPKGMLLTGIPGAGKSLIAKTVATAWGVPLVLLDPARLFSKYIGESEERLIRALESVEAMAPAVLWIDEIEKGFATSGDGDGGVSKRMLGTFLRWMQDRPGGVFVVATANDVSSLPPEFLRRGRFDEIFFVDLPRDGARQAIFETHLERRDLDPTRFELDNLVKATNGFSGAEIETCIVGALYRALAAQREVTNSDVASEVAATVPLSVSRAEDVAALRTWAQGRAAIA